MQLLKHFKELTVRPKNAQELKGLILQLAIQGKLTGKWREENPDIEPASLLLKRISKEKTQLIKEKKIRKGKKSGSIKNEEKYLDIPEKWEWARIIEIGNLFNGNSVNKSEKATKYEGLETGYPYLGTKDINYGFEPLNYDNGVRIPFDEPKFKIAHKNTALICSEGGSAGKKCGITTKDICFGNKLYALEQYGNIEPVFILSIYKTPIFFEIFQSKMTGIIGGISINSFGDIPMPLPPLEEQKAIVEVVETLFKEVEQLEQLTVERITLKEDFVTSALNQLTTNNAKKEWEFLQDHFKSFFDETHNIKKLRETVLQLAVQGKLTADWRLQQSLNGAEVEDASILLKRIKDERKRLVKEKKIKDEKQISSITDEEIPYALPESWVWCRMQDLCPNISSGSTPPKPYFKEEGVPYLKVYNIRNQKIDFDYRKQFVDKEYHSTKLKRSILKPGDVIMNIVGPPLGKVAIIPDDFPEWNCNQAISFFQPLDRKLNTWLYTFLLAGTFLDRIELIGTAGQDNISVTKSKTIMLPLPPLEEQKAIVQKVNALMGLCDALEQEVQQSQEHSEQLMQSCLWEVFENY